MMKNSFLACLALLLLLGSLSRLRADTPDADTPNANTRCFAVTPPAEIQHIFNPEPSFYVRVWVDHEDGVYREGETMTVWARSEEDGWIYVIYQNAENEKALLFPNKYRSDNRVQANKEIRIPADETKDFSLECGAPFGKEYLTVIVSKEPLKTVAAKDLGDQFTPFDEVFYSDFCNEVRVRDFTVKDSTEKGNPQPETTGVRPQPSGIEWAEHSVEITTLPKETKEKGVIRKPERFFIAIAIDEYKDQNIPDLPTCVNDLNKVEELVVSDCGVPAENVKVLVNEEATYAKIKDLFYNVIPKMTERGDTVFIYWSGHGNRIVNTSAKGNEFHETLLAYDSSGRKKETQLIDDEFGVWVQKLEGRKLLFILDSCFSGGMAKDKEEVVAKSVDEIVIPDQKSVPFEFGKNQLFRTKGLGQDELALIGSSAADEMSLCIGGESVMTKVMLETLKSKKEVSHIDLANELKDKVSAIVEEKKGDYSQHPYFQDELSEPLILNP